MIAFPISFMTCAQVARIFYDKEDILQTQELNMDNHHQRMTGLINRLEILRRTRPYLAPPVQQQVENVVPSPPQCVAQSPPPARVRFTMEFDSTYFLGCVKLQINAEH
jgi:hypothetical protein